MEDFVHLHVHSQYSLLDGQSSISRMVDKAVKDGMRGMALTDHGNMFGIKDLFDYCGKVNKGRKKEGLEPLKPIFGCEVYVARRGKEEKTDKKLDLGGNHLILLAKNFNGYKNLIQLVSRAWQAENRSCRPGTLPRGPHLLLGMHSGRGSEQDSERRHRGGEGECAVVQEHLRRRLLPGAAAA